MMITASIRARKNWAPWSLTRSSSGDREYRRAAADTVSAAAPQDINANLTIFGIPGTLRRLKKRPAGGPQLRKSGGPELRKSDGLQPRKLGGSQQRKSCKKDKRP